MPSIQFYLFRPLMRLSRAYQSYLANRDPAAITRFRGIADWLAERLMRLPQGVQVMESQLAGVPVTWFIPDGANSEPILLFLHGGGNVFTWGKPHRRLVAYLARSSGLTIYGPDFRLAPEHPYPAAHEDCFQVYQSLVQQGKKILLVGESSGGVLALSTMLRAKQAGLPLPVLAGFLSPLVDYISPDLEESQDPFAHPDFIMALTNIYLDGQEPSNRDCRPLTASFEGFPGFIILVGAQEILRSETEKLAKKAIQEGLEVEVCLWPDVWHGWQVLVPQLPEAVDALDVWGNRLKTKIDLL